MKIKELLKEKILILDGAMGTMLQKYKKIYNNYSEDELILKIHREYLEVSDIIKTNTFNVENIDTYEKAYKKASLAIKVRGNKEKFVAGSVGPTNKSSSIKISKKENINFNELVSLYLLHIKGLIEAGVDIILIETIFDGLNAKAAVFATKQLNSEIPIMISATIDKNGNLLSGQSFISLFEALDCDQILSFGLNCSFGAKELVPFIRKINTNKFISIHPNAGIPNIEGEYDQSPEMTLKYLKPLIDEGKINIVGGCCGTTPNHIGILKAYTKNKKARLYIDNFIKTNNFIKVGERNNVAGSRKFKRLILEEKYDEAIEIAIEQVQNGAKIIDINLDDSMINGEKEMDKFTKLINSYLPSIPVMIDSSDFKVIKIGLKNIAAKVIVNSISLKEGEEIFLEKAKIIKSYNGSIVVMAFDEIGQAISYERKIEIIKRSYKLLKNIEIESKDIIFDPNVLTIGTGREEDRYHAVNFIKAVKWIKDNIDARTSGGISNISFAFRGNNLIRHTMHDIFLKKSNLNMGLVNPNEIPSKDFKFRSLIEDLIDGKDVIDEILKFKGEKLTIKKEQKIYSIEEKIKLNLITGKIDIIILEKALEKYSAIDIIQNILMDGLNIIGEKFEKGEIYLPQVIKAATAMEGAVKYLTPFMEGKIKKQKAKILMATVYGDVHDIGKNIAKAVLKCNGYEIIDLGVMVEKEKIFKEASKHQVDIITLSGLITPSLEEMSKVLELFKKNNSKIPILIAGATTSKLHTALKLEPIYPNHVFHITDASSTIPVISELINDRDNFIQKTIKNNKIIKEAYFNKVNKNKKIETFEKKSYTPKKPKKLGNKKFNIPIEKVKKYINWDIFFHSMKIKNTSYEKLALEEAKNILTKWEKNNLKILAYTGFYHCKCNKNLIEFENIIFESSNLKNYIETSDYIGAFVLSFKPLKNDITSQLIANTIVEAASEYLENYLSENNWKIKIRPAVGYPDLPDHKLKKDLFNLLGVDKEKIKLTSNYAMSPLSTICGIYIGNPNSQYKNY